LFILLFFYPLDERFCHTSFFRVTGLSFPAPLPAIRWRILWMTQTTLLIFPPPQSGPPAIREPQIFSAFLVLCRVKMFFAAILSGLGVSLFDLIFSEDLSSFFRSPPPQRVGCKVPVIFYRFPPRPLLLPDHQFSSLGFFTHKLNSPSPCRLPV